MRRCFIFLLASLFISAAEAESLNVEYASFYSHLNKIDTEETPALQFAFGFQHISQDRLCKIKQVQIITQKITLPVEVTPENRFTLPTEKALKHARAMVSVDLSERTNQCDMSVQLETKPEHLKASYTKSELMGLFTQYESFFDDMGGFLSFMMPDVVGLHLHFDSLESKFIPEGAEGDTQHLYLNKSWLSQMNQLTLPEKPFRITAMTE